MEPIYSTEESAIIRYQRVASTVILGKFQSAKASKITATTEDAMRIIHSDKFWSTTQFSFFDFFDLTRVISPLKRVSTALQTIRATL